VVGLVLAAGLGVGLFTSIGTPTQATPGVGSAAPSFSLRALGGGGQVGTPADGGGDGRPAVLLFFASWCAPCQSEVPAVAAVYRAQKHDRIPVIGVDGMDPTREALSFDHRSGVTFPVAADSDYTVTEGLYGFDGDPDAVFINAQGTIEHIVHGPITRSVLLAWERRLG
jgi:cytochrome c biogenesis protein CcmG, thiol:disulfide interchange protein DsbE